MLYQRGTKLYFTGKPGPKFDGGKTEWLENHPVVVSKLIAEPYDLITSSYLYRCYDILGRRVVAYDTELSTQRVTGENHDEQDPQR